MPGLCGVDQRTASREIWTCEVDWHEAGPKLGRHYRERRACRVAIILTPDGQMIAEPTVTRDVEIRMRDGVVLRADVYKPAQAGPHPVLLMRVPYSKDIAQTAVYAHPFWYSRRGYIVVVQDTRGRHRSDGTFEPWVHEANDGFDTIEWLAAIQGSNGRVGMYGFSYAGALQLQAAIQHPPHLCAIAPAFTSLDFYGDWIYPGGALSWAFVAAWAGSDLAGEAAHRKGMHELEARIQAGNLDIEKGFWHLPLNEYGLLPSSVAPYFHDWLDHPTRDAFWSARDGRDQVSSIDIPTLHIGGWADVFIEGTLDSFRRLSTRGAARQELLVGPWMHMPWTRSIRDYDAGPEAEASINELQIRWFDRWLKAGSGVEDQPPIRIFAMGTNRWTEATEWPGPTTRVNLHLRSAGRANSRFGDGELSSHRADDEPFDVFVYNPRNPVPSVGGRSCCDWKLTPMGIADQNETEDRNDVLVYTSSALTKPVEVRGAVRLTLWASSSAVDTDFTAKLVDVTTDGRAFNVVDGILRTRHRGTDGEPKFLEPDHVYEFAIDLGSTNWVFAAGDRIRLEVSSSNFPRFNRNANSRKHPNQVTLAELTTAVQRVFHDGKRPSRIELQVPQERSPADMGPSPSG
jgi:putative CocE/NonD family hydrolase